MPSHIVIADDHPLFREALKLAVATTLVDTRITEVASDAALFAALKTHDDVDLLLLDLRLPDAQGFSTLIQARTSHPEVPILVISGHDGPDIVARTLAHGAAGFVPKSASGATLIEALGAVLSGSVWLPTHRRSSGSLDASESDAARLVASLTPQQLRVLVMLCSGLQNKQIGVQLNITEATVKAHMRAIMEKFGASNRTQVVLMAQRLALNHHAEHAST
jgi:DNA-binding NarL/FixJ family response regulator